MTNHSNKTVSELNRKTLLRGIGGVSIGIPFLNLILDPTLSAKNQIVSKHSLKRALFYYIPNGIVNKFWTAKNEKGQLQLGKSLKPLESLKTKINLFRGLDRHRVPGIDGHSQAGSCWLTSCNAQTHKSTIPHPIDRTIDQLIGDRYSKQSVFNTFELSANSFNDNKEAIHFDALSWYGPGNVAHPIKNPILAFDRLFNIKKDLIDTSILDLVKQDAKQLANSVGLEDKQKLDEYYTNLRSIEQKIQKMKIKQGELKGIQSQRPSESNFTRFELMRAMSDIIVLAFQTNMTHSITFMAAPERWHTPQHFEGVLNKPIEHHPYSHRVGRSHYANTLQKIDEFYIEQFAYIAKKMNAIKEGGRTMLDHSLLCAGPGFGNGASHSFKNIPVVTAGSCGGYFKTGQSLHFKKGTPLANLWLEVLHSFDINRKELADSTGTLGEIRV